MKKKIMFFNLIIILMMFFLCFFSTADPVDPIDENLYGSEEVKKIREEEVITSKIYLVQPGDTLWGIAEKFYHNPREWEKIHSANPVVKNPNLIYPGEKLIIPFLTGQVEVVTPSEKVAPAEVVTPFEKIAPEEKIIPAEEKKEEEKEVKKEVITSLEISTVTVEVSIPEEEKKEVTLSREKYLKMKFSLGDFLVLGKWQFDGLITREKEKKILISAGDTVYLNIGSKKGLKPGMCGFVCRKGEKVYDSKTGKFQGRNIQRIGLIEIIEVKRNISSARIVTSSEAIGVGDGIKIILEE